MLSLSGKKAVVTGSSGGIGAAIAIKLAAAGADLVVNYNNNRTGAEEVVAQIQSRGSSGIKVKADVAKFAGAEKLINRALTEYDRIDILVNNAGITRDKLLLRMKEEDWQQVIDVNLTGVFNTTRAAVRTMMKQSAGRIINISSVVGLRGNAGQANYAASKAGVIGFSRSMARELSSRGITVNVVAPGFIRTEMTADLSSEIREKMKENIPLERFGSTDDVAGTVLFLASDLADYITGQVINVDGGMLM